MGTVAERAGCEAIRHDYGTAPPRPSVPLLARGTCQVWWARIDDVGPEHDALLGAADLHRRARLFRAADRRRTTAAAVVAALVLEQHTGTPSHRLRVDRTCPHCGEPHGKPRLADAPDLHFSVSHSAGWAVVAVSRDGPVGVDVEEVGSWDTADLYEVAMLTLAREERAVLFGRPAAQRARAFTTYWTRKEAAVKASGAGLTAALEEILVSPPTSPPRVLRWGTADAGPPPALHALGAPEGYTAALATVGPSAVIHESDAGPLLRAFRTGP